MTLGSFQRRQQVAPPKNKPPRKPLTGDILSTPRPMGTPYSDPIEGQSKVTDMSGMFRKAEKMERLLVRMEAPIRRIPEIETKLDGAVERVTRVEEKVDTNKDRVNALDRRITAESGKPHDCHQTGTIGQIKADQREVTQKLEKDMQAGVVQGTKLGGLEKTVAEVETDISEIRRAPRRMLFGIAGIILTLVTTAGGAVWFLAELNKDVEFERAQRTRIENQIKTMGDRADHRPVLKRLESLERNVDRSQEWERGYNQICKGMTRQKRRFMKNMLRRRGKAVPSSCLE